MTTSQTLSPTFQRFALVAAVKLTMDALEYGAENVSQLHDFVDVNECYQEAATELEIDLDIREDLHVRACNMAGDMADVMIGQMNGLLQRATESGIDALLCALAHRKMDPSHVEMLLLKEKRPHVRYALTRGTDA